MGSPICSNGHPGVHTKRHPQHPVVRYNGRLLKNYLCPVCGTPWMGGSIHQHQPRRFVRTHQAPQPRRFQRTPRPWFPRFW